MLELHNCAPALRRGCGGGAQELILSIRINEGRKNFAFAGKGLCYRAIQGLREGLERRGC